MKVGKCDSCYYRRASNECGHCIHFWSKEEAEEMGLDLLEDMYVPRRD